MNFCAKFEILLGWNDVVREREPRPRIEDVLALGRLRVGWQNGELVGKDPGPVRVVGQISLELGPGGKQAWRVCPFRFLSPS